MATILNGKQVAAEIRAELKMRAEALRKDGVVPCLAVLLAGERRPRGWASGKAQGFDAFDAKAEALALLAITYGIEGGDVGCGCAGSAVLDPTCGLLWATCLLACAR